MIIFKTKDRLLMIKFVTVNKRTINECACSWTLVVFEVYVKYEAEV